MTKVLGNCVQNDVITFKQNLRLFYEWNFRRDWLASDGFVKTESNLQLKLPTKLCRVFKYNEEIDKYLKRNEIDHVLIKQRREN